MGRTVYLEDSYVGPPLTKVIFTLGRHSQDVKTLEKLLRAGMTVAKFDTSVSSEDDLQEGLANLRNAMASTHITCHVVLEKKKKSSRFPDVESMKQPFCNIPEHATYRDTSIKESAKDRIPSLATKPRSDVASTEEVAEKTMDKPVDGIVDSSPTGETITASITKELDALRVNLSKEIGALRASLSAGRQSFSSATLKSMLDETGTKFHDSLLPIDGFVARKSEMEAAQTGPSAVATNNGGDSATAFEGVRRSSAETTTGNIDTQQQIDAVSKSAVEAGTPNMDIQKGEDDSRRSSTNGNAKDMDTQKNLGSESVQVLDLDSHDNKDDAKKDETAPALAPAGAETVQELDSTDRAGGATEADSTTIGALAPAGSESLQANLVIDSPDKKEDATKDETAPALAPTGAETVQALAILTNDKTVAGATKDDSTTIGALSPAGFESLQANLVIGIPGKIGTGASEESPPDSESVGSDKINEIVNDAQTTAALAPASSASDQATTLVDSHDQSNAVIKDGIRREGLKSYEVDSVGNMVVDGRPISPRSRKVNLVGTSPVASPSNCFFSPFLTCCTTRDVLEGTMRTNMKPDDQKKVEADVKQEVATAGGTPGASSMPEDFTVVPDSKKRKLDAVIEGTATQVETSSESTGSQKKTDAIIEASIDALPPADEVGSLDPKTEKKPEGGAEINNESHVLSDLTVAPDATTTGKEADALTEESPSQTSKFEKKIDASEEASVQSLANAAESGTKEAVSSISTTEKIVNSAAENKTTSPDATITEKKIDPTGESTPKPVSTESITAPPTEISTEAKVDATEEEIMPGLLNGAAADAVEETTISTVDHTQISATPTPSMDPPIACDVPGIESLHSTTQTNPAALVTQASSPVTSSVTTDFAPSKPTKPATDTAHQESLKVVEGAASAPPYKWSYVSYGVLAKKFNDGREVTGSSSSVSQPSKEHINPAIPASSAGDQVLSDMPPKVDPPPSETKKMSISDPESGTASSFIALPTSTKHDKDPKELYTVFKAKHRKPEKFKDLESLLRILKILRGEGIEEISWKLP